jgi:hypothetical protein
VAHTCNLATEEAEIRRIVVQSQPRQIVSSMRPYLEKKNFHKKREGLME